MGVSRSWRCWRRVCRRRPREELTVSAAVSLRDALGEDAQAVVLVALLTALSCAVLVAASRLGARAT